MYSLKSLAKPLLYGGLAFCLLTGCNNSNNTLGYDKQEDTYDSDMSSERSNVENTLKEEDYSFKGFGKINLDKYDVNIVRAITRIDVDGDGDDDIAVLNHSDVSGYSNFILLFENKTNETK